MRYSIENLNDITDSREIIASKPKGFTMYMMYIIISLLTVTIIWLILADKEVTITASGMVRPNNEIIKVANKSMGSITEMNISEDMEVKKGDVLLTIDSEELKVQKASLDKTIEDKNNSINNYEKLKKSVLDGKNYFDKSNSMYYQYEDYSYNISDLNTTIKDSEDNLNKLKKQEVVLEEQIKAAQDALDSSKQALEKYKNNRRMTVLNTISQTKQNIQQANISGSTSNTTKEQYISQIDDNIKALENSKIEINVNIESLKSKIEASTVKAESDGIINIISGVKVGQHVNIAFAGLPQKDYGVLKGTVENISADSKVNQKDGSSYYTAESHIDTNFLTNKKGEKSEIKSGMIVEGKIVNWKISYLRYFLEKINILE